MARIYVSYRHNDLELARKLVDALRRRGRHHVTIDVDHLVLGQEWRRALDDAFRAADGLVVLLTENSVDAKEGHISSHYSAADIGRAMASGKVVMPIILKPVRIPDLVRDIHCEFMKEQKDAEDKEYTPEGMGDPSGALVQRLYPAEAMCSMLKECDFVVITVPKTPATLGLISNQELASLKPTAFLIDVSRGGIVDQEALIHALRERKIAGAALDVFPEEPLPPTNPLWKFANVIITPHISGNTLQYDQRAADLFAINLLRYLTGQPLYNRIEPERGY